MLAASEKRGIFKKSWTNIPVNTVEGRNAGKGEWIPKKKMGKGSRKGKNKFPKRRVKTQFIVENVLWKKLR